jgi:hypothetical protein
MIKPTEEYEIVSNYRNYQYAIWFNDVQGYRCGYVQIPENHPYFEKEYIDDLLNITSVGLTFSGHIKGLSGWFIGWDHHHLWDGIDEEGIRNAHSDLSKEELYEILEYARSMAGEPYGSVAYTDDVENECHKVIDELIKISTTERI